ncbi:TPA: aldehyde dehydrogenase family protein [archaeon]|uniref:Aldehyde dehydrogenase family protein n=1 Tax=Candidatus Naiadarchaeum limnaeum TaxID=2756139 RepID=A0A832XIL5_9ARCH|nr:aldehyde dehydrogenase family protein [Candidatus Naiadarchaeum limnaeum]
MAVRIKNYINGKWINSVSGKTLERRNPANTSEVVTIFPRSDKRDVDTAVKAARTAFEKWSRTPAPKRGHYLFKAAEILEQRKNELGKIVTKEMGKILPEGLGDVQEAIDTCYYFAGEGRRLQGETVPSELANKDAKTVREPIGVFGLITPWNFPIAIPSWKIAPALVCGNTVVFKPSQFTPLCATKFVEIFDEVGLPSGVLNLVHGTGSEIGDEILKHKEVDAISFTGSTATGARIKELCAATGKEAACEMGGKNAIIVMDDANLDLALDGAIWGGFGTSGQRCTAASRLILHEKIFEKFLTKFVSRAKKLKLGNGLQKTTQMGPVVNEEQYIRVLNHIEIGKKERAKLLTGGKPAKTKEKGYFIEPTIFIGKPGMHIEQEEIFGPVVTVLKAKNLEHAIQIANDTKYGLVSSIYTQDVNKSARAEKELKTGLVYINAPTIGAEIHLPFGGIKASGSGHPEAGGRGGAIDTYSSVKVIYRDYSGKLQRAQIDVKYD